MALPLWAGMALGGAAIGLAKNEFIDKPRAERMAKAEAAKTYYSPWTGMQGQTVMPPSAADAALKWGATGAMMGANMGGMMGGSGAPAGAEMSAMNYQPQQASWRAMQNPGYSPQMMA